MEFNISKQHSGYIASIFGLSIFIYCLLRWKKSHSTKKHPPEPSGSWPIIGHLHLLGVLPHISLGKMADKHGPLFMIKLGVHRALIVNSHAMAKECLGVNDRVFVDRPQTIFVEHVAYNSAMFGFTLYGPYWREIRKITTVELLKDLLYLDAVLKETLRLYPAGPLSVPRVAVEDCTVSSYHIPAGTQLFVNLYKIHRDPEVWPNPLEFNPERFLTTHKDYDVRGTNFAFIPFGSGRRMCPGITLAYRSMMLALASLLHGFEMSTPSDETVDMTEGFGLTNLKATPLDIILIPRLQDNLYLPPAVVN